MSSIEGCKKCGVIEPAPALSSDQNKIYWIASYKNTIDFSILHTDDNNQVDMDFLVSYERRKPENDKYDYYCPDCFVQLMEDNSLDGEELHEPTEDPI